MIKSKYQSPEAEIMLFSEDIVTASGEGKKEGITVPGEELDNPFLLP